MLLKELKNFSRENWWVYVLLFIVLIIIIGNGRGNIVEIVSLFSLNLIANIFIMAAMRNYSEGKNKTGAIFHASSSSLFVILSLYSLLVKQQGQYAIWQICFMLAAIKAISFYNFEKDLSLLNSYTIGILNVLFFTFFMIYGEKLGFDLGLSSIVMALGFCIVTTGLVNTNDEFRYWFNYVGAFFMIVGAGVGSYMSYIHGELNGVDFGYFVLVITSFIYFSKLLPKYIKK